MSRTLTEKCSEDIEVNSKRIQLNLCATADWLSDARLWSEFGSIPGWTNTLGLRITEENVLPLL